MVEAELQDLFLAELTTLESSGAVLPLHLRPSQAWYLFAALQLALHHPRLPAAQREYLDSLARNIEGRLSNGRPAMTEVARMGWKPEYDQAAAGQRSGGNAAQSPPGPPEPEPEPPAETAKRKPERTPANKQLEPPENKETGKGGRKRK